MTVEETQTRTLMEGAAGTTKPWGEKELGMSWGLGGVPEAGAGEGRRDGGDYRGSRVRGLRVMGGSLVATLPLRTPVFTHKLECR